MKKNNYFLLTRFNVRIPWLKREAPGNDWLKERFSLFNDFCYPSVCSQTAKDFTWLVFFDKNTPKEFHDSINVYKKFPNYIPVFLDVFELSIVAGKIIEMLPEDAKTVITTRLDNDDALSKNHIETVQETFRNMGDCKVVNFKHGYYWEKGRIYHKEDDQSPFFSIKEDVPYIKTGYSIDHTRVRDYGPIRQIENKRGYIQVVHGKNVSNRVPHGAKRIPLKIAYKDFPLSTLEKSEKGLEVKRDVVRYHINRLRKEIRNRLRRSKVVS